MDAYIGEIRIFAGNFIPLGWLPCNGSTVSIQQYQGLFAVINTTYGGDGRTNFKLPDLIGKAPVSQGQGTGLTPRTLGTSFGETQVTLNTSQMAAHNHIAQSVNDQGNVTSINNALWAQAPIPSRGSQTPLYQNANPDSALTASSVTPIGGSQPHNNMQPFLAMYYMICYEGEFPQKP